jgi:hypothetical protein
VRSASVHAEGHQSPFVEEPGFGAELGFKICADRVDDSPPCVFSWCRIRLGRAN